MLFRNKNNTLMEINKLDFTNDYEYYSAVQQFMSTDKTSQRTEEVRKQQKHINNVFKVSAMDTETDDDDVSLLDKIHDESRVNIHRTSYQDAKAKLMETFLQIMQ